MTISIELFDSDAQWMAKHLYVLRTEWMLELRRRKLDAAPDAVLTTGLTADSDTAKRILDRIEKALITPVAQLDDVEREFPDQRPNMSGVRLALNPTKAQVFYFMEHAQTLTADECKEIKKWVAYHPYLFVRDDRFHNWLRKFKNDVLTHLSDAKQDGMLKDMAEKKESVITRAPEHGGTTLAQLLTDSGYKPAEEYLNNPTWSHGDQGTAIVEGWLVVERNEDGTPYCEIQRYDDGPTVNGLTTDDQARKWVDKCAGMGFNLHRRALAYIAHLNSKNAGVKS
jgi:hypothetical protein